MPELIPAPSIVEAAGTKPKRIEEYAGRVNTEHETVSVARMVSPSGWEEPGQRPEFEEITVVLKGLLCVEHEGGTLEVSAGQGVITRAGEWVRYSTPGPEGAEYIAVCLPAFSPRTVHRDGTTEKNGAGSTTPLPTREDIEHLVSFLPRLYAEGMTPIRKWHGGPTGEEGVLQMPWPEYEGVVSEFFHAASRECWRDPGYLSKGAAKMLSNPEVVRNADLAQIKTMLTYCARGERFCDGHWAAMIKSGHIRRLLERLRELG